MDYQPRPSWAETRDLFLQTNYSATRNALERKFWITSIYLQSSGMGWAKYSQKETQDPNEETTPGDKSLFQSAWAGKASRPKPLNTTLYLSSGLC